MLRRMFFQDKLSNAEKLSNKLGSIDEAELDAEKLAEKQTLLLAIEAAKHRIKVRYLPLS